MIGSCGLYPGLGQYFKNKKQMAKAGCMSRTRLDDCLFGRKEFTEEEKVALYNWIRLSQSSGILPGSIFDEQFRITERKST